MQYQAALAISSEAAARIRADFLEHMRAGLGQGTPDSHPTAPLMPSLLMLPSWLSALPSGDETGSALAVDFGGTSFRVMHVVLGTGAGAVRPCPTSCCCLVPKHRHQRHGAAQT